MGSLKSSCTTSYRSSIETIALNFLVFDKIVFLYFGVNQTNRSTGPLHKAALAVASGDLTSRLRYQSKSTNDNLHVSAMPVEAFPAVSPQ